MARAFATASSQYLAVGTGITTSLPRTLACWFYPLDTGNQGVMLFSGDSTRTGRYYLIEQAGTTLNATHRRATTAEATQTTISQDVWQHAAGVFTSTTSRTAYLDGSPGTAETTTVVDVSTDNNSTAVGRANDSSPGDYHDGYIAEAAIWTAALTTPEIETLAAGYSPLFIRPQSLVFYVPLIRDNDEDIIGGLSLTAFNTPTVADHAPVIYTPPPFISYPTGGAEPPAVAAIMTTNKGFW